MNIGVTNADLDRQALAIDALNEWGEVDWSILDEKRGALPPFPEDIFSSRLRECIARAAEGAGVTFDHVAVPLLSIASGVIGASRRVQAAPAWVEPVAWWAAIVGASGSGKTPGFGVSIRALAQAEKLREPKVSELQRKHETKREVAKVALKTWQAQVEEAAQAGQPAPMKPAAAQQVGPFVAPRLMVSDSTIERIAQLIQARPAGLPIVIDELSGLFANMSRYSGGSDRAFWLEAWNGQRFTQERMGREPVTLERLLVSMTGGFQPDKLSTSFSGDSDGMHARILFAWPTEAGYRPLSQVAREDEPAIVNAFMRLAALGDADDEDVFVSKIIPLSEGAREVNENFREAFYADKAALDGREAEWWSKGPSQVLRIAGTLALVEWAWIGGNEPKEIGAETIDGAIKLWKEYFWPHSRVAIRNIGATKKQSHARRILLWLKKEPREKLSVKDVRRDLFSHTIDATETTLILDDLANCGWLRKEKVQTGGKPVVRWIINRVLYEDKNSAPFRVSDRWPE